MAKPVKIGEGAGGEAQFSTGPDHGFGSSGAIVPVDKSAGGTVRKPPKKRSSKFNIKYGTAEVKAFPIQEDELYELGGMGVLASIAFSATTYFASLAVETAKELAFSEVAKPEAITFMQTTETWSTIAAIICGIVGLGLLAFGANKIRTIRKRTTFEEE